MTDEGAVCEFEIDRERVYRYLLVLSTLAVAMTIIGVLLIPLWYYKIGPWVVRRQVDSLRYWLDGGTLRINEGFIFLKQKAIPLDRVTDVVLAQGPLLRRYGLWTLAIQTAGMGPQQVDGGWLCDVVNMAGMGQSKAGGRLCGVVDPEAVRDLILARRDEVAGCNRSGT